MDTVVRKLKTFLKQPCVMCGRYGEFVVCASCEQDFTTNDARCLGCATKIPKSNLQYCGTCLTRPLVFNNAYSLYDYKDWVRDLIFDFKYNQRLAIGVFFATKLFYFYQTLGKYDVVIPMPMHSKRLRARGCNHVLELVRLIGREVRIDNNSIARTKYTKELHTLNVEQRRAEIKNVFSVAKDMNYSAILIVDDILTTTTSVSELSKTIIKHYKKRNKTPPHIDVLTLAKA